MMSVPAGQHANLLSYLKACCSRWLYGDSPVDVETEYLRSLFGSFISSSPAIIFASVYLYFSAPVLPLGPALPIWVSCHVGYHVVRFSAGVSFQRRKNFSLEDLRRWSFISWLLQLMGGALMLCLALWIYPQLEFMAQTILLMVSFIVVGSSAFSLAGRWATIAVYATPTYFGYAWSTWPLEHAYAKPLALLSLMFFVLYLFQARAQHRANVQGFSLARQNGELADELKVKNAELQEVAAGRSRLLATVSHDLRQPAHAIGLLCERSLVESNPAFLKESLSDLNELSQSLSASLTTLMDLTRLDAGLVNANLRPLALNQVLMRLEAEFAGSARNKGLTLRVAHSDLWIRSDPVLLHGVLANLVSNAIKYTRAGNVLVDLSTQDDEITISVKDTGMGIRQDKLELIFKEFVRLDGAESGTEGLGLGLSIVRRYADLMGHGLQVSSTVHKGSCFSISVPAILAVANPAEVQALSRTVDLDDVRLQGLSVLVVDNVDLVLSSMVRTLSAWGCDVHSARSLSEACAVTSGKTLDLLISDFHLGDGEPDGLTLIKKLRALQQRNARDLPALLMTGDVSSHLEADAARNGVGILHKPVRPAVLQHRFFNLLQAPQAALGISSPAP